MTTDKHEDLSVPLEPETAQNETPGEQVQPDGSIRYDFEVPFGPGHPFYHEDGNFLVRGTLNAAGLINTGLLRSLAWRQRNKQRSSEWSQAMRERSDARRERAKADSDARTHLHHVQMAAIRTGNPNTQRAYLETKRQYYSDRALQVGQKVVELSTAQPRRYEVKVRRQEKKKANYEEKARQAAGKLITQF